MEKSKKFRMPAGIRNKLMAAVAMLLISSIMMVTSTYAWFTLSTAPEVTGITTSVGANGNLEMALLNGQTFADPTQITSNVGDSSAMQDVTQSNITWGNLVDLSHSSYGLNLVALNPARLNYTGEDKTTVRDTLLLTAVYGADGRVSELKENTISGVYDITGKWVTTQTFEVEGTNTEFPAHGVRAIGVDSNMSTAQIVLNAAKAAVNSGKNGASSAVSTAVGAHQLTFMTLAMSLGGEAKATYGAEEMAALLAVAKGVQSSLNIVVKTYANAILAFLSTADISDAELTILRTQLSAATDAATLSNALTGVSGVNGTYVERLSDLAAAQTAVADVIAACGTYADGTNGEAIKEEIIKPLIGTTVVAEDKDGEDVTPSMENATSLRAVYVTGGLVSEVAEHTGTYAMVKMTEMFDLTVYAGAKGIANTLAVVAGDVSELTIGNTENAQQTIADFYGYIIDFAFRTNAASSNLQLQTAAANRVYSNAEGENLATQGAGSTATFAFDSSLKEEQVRALMDAINLVFLNPMDGTVYGVAQLTDVNVGTTEATANVKMVGQTEDVATIVALPQNIATRVSVLVYLDGDKIDNGDVANSASSGMLNLNLQFSSSAELVPMQNTALENMTAYAVSFNANGGFGFMPSVKASGTYSVPTTASFTAPEGYEFKGWATTADATEVITAPFDLEGNTILYAIWKAADVTVSYNLNGGSADLAAVTVQPNAEVTLPNGDSITAPDGKVFGGWEVNGQTKQGGEKITVTADVVVKAIWNDETPVEPVTGYAVYVNDNPAETTATDGQDYMFTLTEGETLVSVTVDGSDVSGQLTHDGNSYTIPGSYVTGEIRITTAPASSNSDSTSEGN